MTASAPDPAAMHRRRIPKSGVMLPVVGIGTWQGFDVGASDAERAPLREVLAALFAAGGSVIDSSPMYGRAEAVVGDLLAEAGERDRAFLATKVWTEGKARGIAQMRTSLERLRTGRIELMQVHNLVGWEAHLETLAAWKADGIVGHVGITHYTPSAYGRLVEVMRRHDIDFVQLAYSIAVTDAERTLLPLAEERGIAVLVNRPLDGGGMFARVRGRALPGWAAELDIASWGQFFLKYVIGHPAVTCVIPGTGDPAHARDDIAAGLGRIPDEADRRRMLDFWRGL